MARALQDILNELDAGGYTQTRQLINDQLAALPGQADAQVAGLNAQKDAAFNQITAGAQDRGMGFSGIPLADQSKYVATDFLPAIAKVQQTQNDTRGSLLNALNSSEQEKMKFGQSLYQNDLNLDEQKRQFDAQQAAARAAAAASNGAFNGLFSGGGTPAAGAAPKAQVATGVQQRADKGFNFTDQAGHSVNAYQYAQGHGIPLRTLLQQMASAGDTGAAAGLQFIGNDGNADPTKVTNQALANLYKSLTGRGVGIYRAPALPTAGPGAFSVPTISQRGNPLGLKF
jgi:hypothetical protein